MLRDTSRCNHQIRAVVVLLCVSVIEKMLCKVLGVHSMQLLIQSLCPNSNQLHCKACLEQSCALAVCLSGAHDYVALNLNDERTRVNR